MGLLDVELLVVLRNSPPYLFQSDVSIKWGSSLPKQQTQEDLLVCTTTLRVEVR